jgi:CheY-like chemotaxis protein
MNRAITEPSAATRILIVDDSRAIQAIIRRVVERIGYPTLEVRAASTGQDGLQAVGAFQPHLVLSDWHMPGMSGIEMFQAMRQEGLAHVKVGFITTESSPQLLQQAHNNGAAFILHKPFRDEDLVQAITALLPVEHTVADQASTAAPAPVEPLPAEPVIAEPLAATAAAPPTEPPALARDDLLDEDVLRGLLRSTLGEIPFRMIRHERLDVGELTSSNLLGIYTAGARAVAAVALLDCKAVCILGGGAAGLMPNVVRAAMSAGQPSEKMIELAGRFLRIAADQMSLGNGQPTPTLSKANMVPQTMKKLEEILTRSQRRIDCRVSVPGYGEGRFSFLAV